MTVRILLAADHPLELTALRFLLSSEPGFALVGEAGCGEETQRLCIDLNPDVLLLDVQLPGPAAVETIQFIQESRPGTKIVVLMDLGDEAIVGDLAKMNVAGYVLEDEAPETLLPVMRASMMGEWWSSQRVVELIGRANGQQKTTEELVDLTERELEVLRLVGQGCTNEQIAECLGIVEGPVKNHVSSIYDKLALHSRAEVVAWFWRNRVV